MPIAPKMTWERNERERDMGEERILLTHKNIALGHVFNNTKEFKLTPE